MDLAEVLVLRASWPAGLWVQAGILGVFVFFFLFRDLGFYPVPGCLGFYPVPTGDP